MDQTSEQGHQAVAMKGFFWNLIETYAEEMLEDVNQDIETERLQCGLCVCQI